MSQAENKAVVERLWNEVIGQGNLAVVDQIIAPDFTVELAPDIVWTSDDLVFPITWGTGTVGPEDDEIRGPDGIKRYVKALHEDLHNVRVYIHEQLAAEGDRILVRWSAQGSNSGEGTETSEASTEDSVTTTGISIYSFSGGKISKEASVIKQLIVTPIPEEGRTGIYDYYGGKISENTPIIKQLIVTPKMIPEIPEDGGFPLSIGYVIRRHE
jgi:SnoaL-like domain